jgi:hypothetical protein
MLGGRTRDEPFISFGPENSAESSPAQLSLSAPRSCPSRFLRLWVDLRHTPLDQNPFHSAMAVCQLPVWFSSEQLTRTSSRSFWKSNAFLSVQAVNLSNALSICESMSVSSWNDPCLISYYFLHRDESDGRYQFPAQAQSLHPASLLLPLPNSPQFPRYSLLVYEHPLQSSIDVQQPRIQSTTSSAFVLTA